jgi:hypothetical protein
MAHRTSHLAEVSLLKAALSMVLTGIILASAGCSGCDATVEATKVDGSVGGSARDGASDRPGGGGAIGLPGQDGGGAGGVTGSDGGEPGAGGVTGSGGGEPGVGGVTGAGGAEPGAGGTSGTDAPVAGSDADPNAMCLPSGATCVTDMGCCSKLCDATSKTCKSSIAACSAAGTNCSVGTDCCSLSCVGGKCGTAACTMDGQACSSASACCSGTCTSGLCQAVSANCTTAGNACTDNSTCCSRLCQNGKCALGASYCIQTGDVCYRSADCCTGLCEKASGAAAGVCKVIDTRGAGSCTQDGIVCADCTNCCSRLCAPYALTGVKICQPASGCKLTNNLCQKDNDCCGGDTTVVSEGTGSVTCEMATTTTPPIGTCRNPTGCQVRGNVCGRREGDNLCGGNAREDCCDCPPPKFNCCKPDTVGIYRCHGGGSATCPTGYTGKAPCCIAGGERCQLASECCDGTPCVPDGQGVLRCLAKPPGGIACVAAAGLCTTTGDCCAGLACSIVPGETFGHCQAPPAPPPPTWGTGGASGTGGTTGSGTGGTVAGTGGTVAGTGGTTAGTGGTSPPPVCGFVGQGCSATTTCCNGLLCVITGTHTACDGASSCICNQIID